MVTNFFDVAGLGRQHIGNVIRQDPSRHEINEQLLKLRFYRAKHLISEIRCAKSAIESRLLLCPSGATSAISEDFKEFRGTRVQDHHVAFVSKTAFVSFQAAIKLGELGIPVECLGIYFCSLGIALAFDFLRISVSVSNRHLALAVCVSTDFFTLSSAG
jgi:hypothetical protein